jgi:hypothetical protein
MTISGSGSGITAAAAAAADDELLLFYLDGWDRSKNRALFERERCGGLNAGWWWFWLPVL